MRRLWFCMKEGCYKPPIAKGLCDTHYRNQLRGSRPGYWHGLGGKKTDPAVIEGALGMVAAGKPVPEILERYEIHRSTLAAWVRQRRLSDPDWMPIPGKLARPSMTGCKVAQVRRVLQLLDKGKSPSQIERMTPHSRQTIRDWRDYEQFREATLEYDSSMVYSADDLMDRAVVAQHLCSQTRDVGERMDLLMAIVGFDSGYEPLVKHGYGRALKEVS